MTYFFWGGDEGSVGVQATQVRFQLPSAYHISWNRFLWPRSCFFKPVIASDSTAKVLVSLLQSECTCSELFQIGRFSDFILYHLIPKERKKQLERCGFEPLVFQLCKRPLYPLDHGSFG